MDRDKQIELLKGAAARIQGVAASWMQDSRAQATLKHNRESVERLKRENERRMACG